MLQRVAVQYTSESSTISFWLHHTPCNFFVLQCNNNRNLCAQHYIQPSIEQVHVHTQSLVKEMATMKETIRLLNDRNRRMEDALVYITTTLKSLNQFTTSPNAEFEDRTLTISRRAQSETQLEYN